MLKLRDLWVPCPNNPVGFINRSYGEEAVETCMITHQHLPQQNKGMLRNWEKSVEEFVGLGVYGKKFPCSLVPGDTPPLPPLEQLRWLHWIFFGGITIFLVGLTTIIIKKNKGA